MIRTRMSIGLMVLGSLLWAMPAHAVRIKDVGSFEGVRDNQLIGYGLVVGLDRTGDQVIGGQFTIQAMMSMLNKMGINLVINPIQLLTRNIASVIVTAKLPPFAKPGATVDVLVSSMANAKSLQGGTLLLTPLKAANQQVYAVAQGPVSPLRKTINLRGSSLVVQSSKRMQVSISNRGKLFRCFCANRTLRRRFGRRKRSMGCSARGARRR
jgi:flagellar basal body P-ring protein FlgI